MVERLEKEMGIRTLMNLYLCKSKPSIHQNINSTHKLATWTVQKISTKELEKKTESMQRILTERSSQEMKNESNLDEIKFEKFSFTVLPGIYIICILYNIKYVIM